MHQEVDTAVTGAAAAVVDMVAAAAVVEDTAGIEIGRGGVNLILVPEPL